MYETSARFSRKKFCRRFAISTGPHSITPTECTRFLRKVCTAVIASAALVPWPWMSPSTYTQESFPDGITSYMSPLTMSIGCHQTE